MNPASMSEVDILDLMRLLGREGHMNVMPDFRIAA